MKQHPRAAGACAFLTILGIAALAAVIGWPTTSSAAGKKPKRDKVDESAVAAAQNKTCFECHIDFEKERLTTKHARKGVSCVRCHGVSLPHMEDETRGTKADAKFSGATMKVFCLTCHSPSKWARESDHRKEMAKPKPRTCVQCHKFEHFLVPMPDKKPKPKKKK